MWKRVLLAAAMAGLSACSTAGNVTPEQVALVRGGMTADEVRAAMGEPGDRTFRDRAQAWQYCRDTMLRDQYSTVWLLDDRVVSLTNYSLTPEGPCAAYYREIDWGQAPPDIRISLEGDRSLPAEIK